MAVFTSYARINVTLSPEESWRQLPVYSDHDTEIQVQSLEINGAGTIWVKGPIVKKDGTLGSRHQEICLDLDDLPLSMVSKLCRHLLEGR